MIDFRWNLWAFLGFTVDAWYGFGLIARCGDEPQFFQASGA